MQDFFFSDFWLIAFVVLIIIETMTYNLVTIWFALACIPLMFLTELAWHYQLLIFVLLSTLLLLLTRPLVLKKLKQKKDPNKLVGKKITVTKKICVQQSGEGKMQNGVTWTVVSSNGGEIDAHTLCEIVQVNGNTLTVKPV